MNNFIYFDNSATTCLGDGVFDAMKEFLVENYANPSALYETAQRARAVVEKSREKVSSFINAGKNEVFFTASGTEANNWAVFGSTIRKKLKSGHIITTEFEHSAVLECVKFLEDFGFDVTYLKPNKEGFIDKNELKNSLRKDTIFVSIMYVNNEIGTIQDIKGLCEVVKNFNENIIFHTDAVQGLSEIRIDVVDLGVDALTLSAHKVGGPKGIGLFYIKSGVEIENLILGGSQERSRRAGTENVANIVGFTKALENLDSSLEENVKKRLELRNYLVKKLSENFTNYEINASLENRHSGNLNVSFFDMDKEMIIMNMDFNGIYLSSGSACSSGSVENSRVLKAIGVDDEKSSGAIRISLSKENTKEEIDIFIEKLKEIFE